MTAYTRQRAIIAKIESVYGTDSTPVGPTNTILCSNITVTPIAGSTADRQLAFPDFSSVPKKHVNKHVQIQFDVEFAGSSVAAGTPLPYGALLRCCCLSETIVAVTSVTYAPISVGQESATIYSNEGGTLHALVGARGNVSLIFAKDAIPVWRFTIFGKWTLPIAAALPALSLTGWAQPLPMGQVNTPTFTFDTFPAVLEGLQIDFSNMAVHRDRPNAEYVATPGRQVTGSLEFEEPPIGTKNFFMPADFGKVMQLIHGTAGGNLMQLDATKAQLLQPAYGDSDGVRTIKGNLQLNRGANGDDEFLITVT